MSIEVTKGKVMRNVERVIHATLALLMAVAVGAACAEGANEGEPVVEGEPDAGVAQEEMHLADEGEEPGHMGEVHLGTERARALGIRVEPVVVGSARSVVLRPATVLLDPDRKALVGPRLEAKVVRVVADLGDEVEEGDTLAVLSSVDLGRAKSTFLTARARANTAEAGYRRERSLFEQQISSEAEMLEAQALFAEGAAERDAAREALRLYGLTEDEIDSIEAGGEVPLSYFALRSPMRGRVQRRDVSPGQSVGPGGTPIHVADVGQLWVMIDAYDSDVPLLEEGRAVALSVRGFPDRSFQGVIDWISYELDPETRTLKVRAVVSNPDGVLRAGMYGTARLQLASDLRRAVLPVDAVQRLEGQSVVFVPADEPGAFLPVEVALGEESEEGLVEIVSGIAPGDAVVVEGAFDLMSAATAAERSADHSH